MSVWIPEFSPAWGYLPVSFVFNDVLPSCSWVMFSFPQKKLWMHCSIVLKHRLLLWKAGGQPDISSPCNYFVSSAQMPEQFILEVNILTKTRLGVENSISKVFGIPHAISIHRSYFLCISGNSLARCGIHPPFPLLGFNTLETLVLNPGASLSSTCTSFSRLRSSVLTEIITNLPSMTVIPFSSIHSVNYNF